MLNQQYTDPHSHNQLLLSTRTKESISSTSIAAPVFSQSANHSIHNISSSSSSNKNTIINKNNLEVTIERPYDDSSIRSSTVVISSNQKEQGEEKGIQNNSDDLTSKNISAASSDGKLLATIVTNTSSCCMRINLVSDLLLKAENSDSVIFTEIENPHIFSSSSSPCSSLRFHEKEITTIQQSQRFDDEDEEGNVNNNSTEIVTTQTCKTYFLVSVCQREIHVWGIQLKTTEEERFVYHHQQLALPSSTRNYSHHPHDPEKKLIERTLSMVEQTPDNNNNEDEEDISSLFDRPLTILRGHTSLITSISLSGPTLGGLFSSSTNIDQHHDETNLNHDNNMNFLIASSSGDETVRVWEISICENSTTKQNAAIISATSRHLSTCIGHNCFINSTSISRDGLLVASGGEGDCCIRLWNSWNGRMKQQQGTKGTHRDLILKGHKSFINCVVFSPVSDEGMILVSSSLDRTIRIWDTFTGTQQRVIYEDHHNSGMPNASRSCLDVDFCCIVSSSSQSSQSSSFVFGLVSKYEDGTVRLWNSQNGNLIREITASSSENNDNYNSSFVVIHVDPQQVSLEDASSSHSSSSSSSHSDGNNSRSISNDQSRSASYNMSATPSRSVSILTTMHHQHQQDNSNNHQQNKSPSSLSSGANHHAKKIPFLFAINSNNTNISIIDLRNGVCLSRPQPSSLPSSYVYCVASAKYKNLSVIASAHADGSVRLLMTTKQNDETGNSSTTAMTLPLLHQSKVRSVSFSPNGKLLVSASEDHTIRVWELFHQSHQNHPTTKIDPKPKKFIHYQPQQPDLKLRKQIMAKEDADGEEKQQAHSRDGLLLGHTSHVYKAIFSNHQHISLIASCSHDKTVRIWNVEDGTCLAILKGHTKDVSCVAFSSATTNLLASCSHDKTIRVWDLTKIHSQEEHEDDNGEDSSCLKFPPLVGHTAYVNTIIFSTNSNNKNEILISASDDKTIRFWNMSSSSLSSSGAAGGGSPLMIYNPTTSTSLSLVFVGIHTSWIYSLALSPDGSTLISASRDRTICVWDVDEICGKSASSSSILSISTNDPTSYFLKSPPLLGHVGRVRSVCTSSSSSASSKTTTIVSGGAEGTIRLWTLPKSPFGSFASSSHNDNDDDNNQHQLNNNINFKFDVPLRVRGSYLQEAKLVGKNKHFIALTISNFLTNSTELKIFPWKIQHDFQQSRLLLIELQELISMERILRAQLQVSELHHFRRIAVLNHEIDMRYELMRQEVFDAEKIFRVCREAKAVSALLWWVQLEERQDRIRIRMNRYVDVELGVRQWIWMQFLTLNPITRRERLIATREVRSNQNRQQVLVDPQNNPALLTARVNGPEVVVRRGRTIILKLRGHMRTVTCGAFSTDGLALATASGAENRMMLWRISDGRLATDYRVVRHPKHAVMNEVGWACENTLLWTRDEDGNVCGYQIYGRKLKYKNKNEKNRIVPMGAGPCLGCGMTYPVAPFDWKCTNCQNPADLWPIRYNKKRQVVASLDDGTGGDQHDQGGKDLSKEKPSITATSVTTATTSSSNFSQQTNPVAQIMCLFCGTDFRQTASRVRCGGCNQYVCEKCVAIAESCVWTEVEIAQVEKNKALLRKSASPTATAPTKKVFPVCYDCCARCSDLPPYVDPVQLQIQQQQQEQQKKQQQKEKERKEKEERKRRDNKKRHHRGSSSSSSSTSSSDSDSTSSSDSSRTENTNRPSPRRLSVASTHEPAKSEKSDNSSIPRHLVRPQQQHQHGTRKYSPDVSPSPENHHQRTSSSSSEIISQESQQQQLLLTKLEEILQLSEAISFATISHSLQWMDYSLKDCCNNSNNSPGIPMSLVSEETAKLLLKQVDVASSSSSSASSENKNSSNKITLESVSVGSAAAYALRSLKEKVLTLDSDVSALIKKQNQKATTSLQKQNFLIEKAVHDLCVPLANCLSLIQSAATALCRITSNYRVCSRLLRKLVAMQHPIIQFAISSLISQYFSIAYSSASASSPSPAPPPFSSPTTASHSPSPPPNFLGNHEIAASIINMSNFFSSRDSQSSAGSTRRSFPTSGNNNNNTSPHSPPSRGVYRRGSYNNKSNEIADAQEEEAARQEQQQQQTALFERDVKILYDFEEKLSLAIKDAVALTKKFTTSMSLVVDEQKQNNNEPNSNNNNSTNHIVTVLNKFGTIYYALIINELKFVDLADMIYNQLLLGTPNSLINNQDENNIIINTATFSSTIFNMKKHERVLALVFAANSSLPQQRVEDHSRSLSAIMLENSLKDQLLFELRREQSFVAEQLLGICSFFGSSSSSKKLQQQLPSSEELKETQLIIVPRSTITFGGKIGNAGGEFSTARKCIMNGVPVVLKTYNSGLSASANSTMNSSTGSLPGSPINNNNNNNNPASALYKQIAQAEFKLLKGMLLKHNSNRNINKFINNHIVHTFGILDDGCSVILEYLGDSLTTRIEKYWTSIVQHQNETGLVKRATSSSSFFTTSAVNSSSIGLENDEAPSSSFASSPTAAAAATASSSVSVSAASSPLLRRGELIDYRIQKIRDRERIAAFRITVSLLLAVINLHNENIYHRDLRPSNVFFSLKGSCDTTLKLIDFAHAVLPPSKSSWHARVSLMLQKKEFEKLRYEAQEKQQLQQPEDFSNVDMKGFDRLSNLSQTYLSSDPTTPHKNASSSNNNNQSSYQSLAMKQLPQIQKCDDNLIYAPPESFKNFLDRPSAVANPSSSEEVSGDMFSLGVVLIELWTKRRAYHCYEKNPQIVEKNLLLNTSNALNIGGKSAGAAGGMLDDDEEIYSICVPPPHDELVRMKLTGVSPFPNGLYEKKSSSASAATETASASPSTSSTRRFPLSIKSLPPIIALLITSLCTPDPSVRPTATFVRDQLTHLFATFAQHQDDNSNTNSPQQNQKQNSIPQVVNLETVSEDMILSVLNSRRNQIDPALFGVVPTITISSSEDERSAAMMMMKGGGGQSTPSTGLNVSRSPAPSSAASHQSLKQQQNQHLHQQSKSSTNTTTVSRSNSSLSQQQQPQPLQPSGSGSYRNSSQQQQQQSTGGGGALSVNVSSNSSLNNTYDDDDDEDDEEAAVTGEETGDDQNNNNHQRQYNNNLRNSPVQPLQPSSLVSGGGALLQVPKTNSGPTSSASSVAQHQQQQQASSSVGGGSSNHTSSSHHHQHHRSHYQHHHVHHQHQHQPQKQSSTKTTTTAATATSSSSKYSYLKTLDVASEVKAMLKNQMLDEKSFLLLEDEDLKDIGVPLGPRKLLLKEIAARKEKREAMRKKADL